jgi:hypothetical protein
MPQMNLIWQHKSRVITNTFDKVGGLVQDFIRVVEHRFLEGIWHDLSYKETPVCTGYAAANWYITAGFPKLKSNHGEEPKWESKNVICAIKYKPDSSQGDMSKYSKKATVWHLSNPTSYISKLNNGFSKKAAANFVETTIYRHLRLANGMNYV